MALFQFLCLLGMLFKVTVSTNSDFISTNLYVYLPGQCLFLMEMELMLLNIVFLLQNLKGEFFFFFFLLQIFTFFFSSIFTCIYSFFLSITVSMNCNRISITFRKMDDRKLPYMYIPERDLMGIKPLVFSSGIHSERWISPPLIDFERYEYISETDYEEMKMNANHYSKFPNSMDTGISRKKKKFYFQSKS